MGGFRGREAREREARLLCKDDTPVGSGYKYRRYGRRLSLAFQGADVWLATLLVGLVTMLFSAVGLKVGNLFGNHYKLVAELVGGLILLFIGIDILVTHLSA